MEDERRRDPHQVHWKMHKIEVCQSKTPNTLQPSRQRTNVYRSPRRHVGYIETLNVDTIVAIDVVIIVHFGFRSERLFYAEVDTVRAERRLSR